MSGGTGDVLAPMLHFPGLEPDWSRLVCGDANRVAAGLAARPEAWAGPALCITGPRACGLTYMGRAWVRRFRGRFLAPDAFACLARADLDAAGADRVALDDAESVSRWPEDQLLSLLNIAGARGGRILLLSHRPPSVWETRSADLRSRLNALPVAEILAPDEAHLRARLSAAAARHFMKLSPETVNYIITRIDLCYEAVETVAERLSAAVSQTGKAPGLALARQVLEGLDADDETGSGEG